MKNARITIDIKKVPIATKAIFSQRQSTVLSMGLTLMTMIGKVKNMNHRATLNARLNSSKVNIWLNLLNLVSAENAASLPDTVAYLADLGVPAVALSSPLQCASAEERQRLQEAMDEAQDAAHAHGLALIWDLAAPYSHVNPVEQEAGLTPGQVVRQHLYIEPDGDVLPAQGYNVVLGNLLHDAWSTIWEHTERTQLADSGS